MKIPCLTAAIVNDDDALAVAVNELVMGSKTIRRFSKRVLGAQERLQQVVDRRAWKRYLRLEEIGNDRTSQETDLTIRWAFEAGKRHGIALGVRRVSCSEQEP